MARTTITIPRNILLAFRKYMALNGIPLREQSKVVEDALKLFFERHDIDVNKKNETKSKFLIFEGRKEKISISIRDALLKALRIYTAYQGLTQHDQSNVAALALQEFLLENSISIDANDIEVIKFDVVKEEYIGV